MSKILEGIKVVELGTHIAVPNVSRMMADWGADVIKVEPPKGEAWRTIGNSYGVPYAADCNPIFEVPNANKRSLVLNLKAEDGLKALLDLLAGADVFLTNTRPRSLKKLGLDYESLRMRFPRLIYAHFSGYGTAGPDQDRPGYDIAAYWAKAGMPVEWSLKEGIPFRPLPGFGDGTVASVTLSGVLAALYGREKTGLGECINTSLYASALWFNSCGIVSAQYQKEAYPRSRYEQPSPYHLIYKTSDGDFFFFSAPGWDAMYDKLLRLIHLEGYIGDPRFATLAGTRANMKEVADLLDQAFAALSTQQVREIFTQLDVVCEVLAQPKQVLTDEQAWANGFLEQITMENGQQVTVSTPPVHFTNAETRPFHLAPQLGAHTIEILREIGYNEEKIQALAESGAIAIRN